MNKKVFITGAGGFIGSHLAELCVKTGYDVKAFIRYNSRNLWGWLENSDLTDKIEVITGDIRDYDCVYSAVKGCDEVYHLAALIGIPYSYVSPLAYIKTNIEGTYNILKSTQELNVRNIIITSTSETYGTARYVPIDENHPMAGQSPYSATKIGADQLALSFGRSFDLPVKIVRPFNVYGPKQSARAIIPTIITQILSGKTKLNIGNLYPTRDFTYVKDTVKGFLEIAKSDTLYSEVTNIGMNKEISIEDLARLIVDLMDADLEIETDVKRLRPEKSEVDRLCCDNSKIMKHTKWRPEYKLETGLKETVRWIKDNIGYYKTEIYNL